LFVALLLVIGLGASIVAGILSGWEIIPAAVAVFVAFEFCVSVLVVRFGAFLKPE
jgi:hypothetical protein